MVRGDRRHRVKGFAATESGVRLCLWQLLCSWHAFYFGTIACSVDGGRVLAGRTGPHGFAALCTGKEGFEWKRGFPVQHCYVSCESKKGEM